MKKAIFVLLLTIPFFISGKLQKEKESAQGYLSAPAYKQLAPRYQEWLNMVAYIATSEEKNVFLKLPNDRDRELFMQIFWQHRDPTPGTEANEFRQEIERRFAYVNATFHRGTPKPGWMTDMGRMYMILGKPQTIDYLENEPGLFPSQVWSYQGEETLGLPAYFNIIFFKRQGMGEWVLYDHLADGPAALIINSEEYNTSDYRQVFERIKKLAPTLAQPSISMIPGQIPYGYSPSPQNNMIMSNILRSPVRKINPAYATGFLNYKGMVSVETSTRYIDNAHASHLWKDPRRGCWISHFAVKPKKISVDFNRDKQKYYFNIRMISSLKHKERVIFQQTRNFDYYLDSGELEILKAGGLVLEDAFPVSAGDHTLSVYIENQVGKEFSYFDTELHVPAADTLPRLAAPLLGYLKAQTGPEDFAPYQILGEKLSFNPENIYAIGDALTLVIAASGIGVNAQKKGRIEWEVEAIDSQKPWQLQGSVNLGDYPSREDYLLALPFPALFPRAGYYRLTLRLYTGAYVPVDSKTLDLSMLPVNRLSRPTEMYQQISAAGSFQFSYILGLQLFQTEDLDLAEGKFSECLQANPGFREGEKMLLETNLLQKKYDRVLERVDHLQNDDKYAFDRHRIKGQAFFGLARYQEALDEFLAANRIINNDFQLINLIGHTYLNLGNREEAAKAYEASLRLNSDQPVIRKQLEEIKKVK